MQHIIVMLLVTLSTASLEAAWYQKTDGSIADPILDLNGDPHSYSGNNLEPLAMLVGAALPGADLESAHVESATMTSADLTAANLSNAILQDLDLQNATLNGATLTGADLDSANLNNANLTGANLTEVLLYDVILSGANLSGSILTSTLYYNDASWTEAFYYTDNEPTWNSGMNVAWRSSVGIMALDPPNAVPEPSTIIMMILGLSLLSLRTGKMNLLRYICGRESRRMKYKGMGSVITQGNLRSSSVVFAMIVAVGMLPSVSHATPLFKGKDRVSHTIRVDGSSGTKTKSLFPRWEYNSKIHVVIDPDPHDRNELIKEGIERWQPRFNGLETGIEIVFSDSTTDSDGNPLENLVRVSFKSDGASLGDGDYKTVLGERHACAMPSHPTGNPFFESGKIYIWDEYDDAGEGIINVSEHEFGHILGFGHYDGDVMRPIQNSDHRHQEGSGLGLSRKDQREFYNLYGKELLLAAEPQSEFHFVGHDPAANSFMYEVHFNPLADVPLEQQHNHLLFLDIDPSIVTDISISPGWVALLSDGPVEPATEPFFFLDEYMVGVPVELYSQWGEGAPSRSISLRASHELAMLYGLPPDLDPGISVDTPMIEFTIHTIDGVTMSLIDVYGANDIIHQVYGPTTPEPATLLLAILGLALLPRRRRR